MSVAVVFGGPSPEHDISILTGLQAARTLSEAGVPVEALYWAKSGSWHGVDPALEASDFVEGVPRKARDVQLVAAPGGGFVGRRRPLDVDVVVNCCHGGPGEDGTLQGVFELAGLRATGPGMVGASLGMDKLAFAAVLPILRDAGASPASPHPGHVTRLHPAIHRQAPLRRVVDRCGGGRRPRRRPWPCSRCRHIWRAAR